jgi:hypothetical protein
MADRLTDAEIDALLGRRDLFAEDSPAHLALAELRDLRALIATPWPECLGDQVPWMLMLSADVDEADDLLGVGATLIRAALKARGDV